MRIAKFLASLAAAVLAVLLLSGTASAMTVSHGTIYHGPVGIHRLPGISSLNRTDVHSGIVTAVTRSQISIATGKSTFTAQITDGTTVRDGREHKHLSAVRRGQHVLIVAVNRHTAQPLWCTVSGCANTPQLPLATTITIARALHAAGH